MLRTPRILLTGFEPFGPWAVNSSGEAVRLVGARRPDLATAVLPVDHAEAARAVRRLIRQSDAEVVLLTGLAAGAALRLEMVARPRALASAPGVRRTRWPIGRALLALRARRTAARLSWNAGGYVCDTTYWAALGERAPRCLFLHVPPLGGAWTAERIAREIGTVLSSVTTGPRPGQRRSG